MNTKPENPAKECKKPIDNAINAPPNTILVDYERYYSYFDDPDLSNADKKALLDTLVKLLVNFIDLGFGVHPLQQACEQPLDFTSLDPGDVLELTGSSPRATFANAAAQPNIDETKRSA